VVVEGGEHLRLGVVGSPERIDCKLPARYCAREGVPEIAVDDSQKGKHAQEPRTCQDDEHRVQHVQVCFVLNIALSVEVQRDEGVALTHNRLESEQSSSGELRSSSVNHACVVHYNLHHTVGEQGAQILESAFKPSDPKDVVPPPDLVKMVKR